MIQISDSIWVGDSTDERHSDLDSFGIGAILNVAQDLECSRGWMRGIDYMQVGLIDGPGNPLSVYYAAALALHTLLKRSKVLVCCHSGGRALAAVAVYLNITNRFGWDGILSMIGERLEESIPVPHEAHRIAFNRINWNVLMEMIK